MWYTFVQGFLIGLSLIVAIGAQNAFVLQQGLLQRPVFWICFICALSDSLLIWMGVTGFSKVLQNYPQLLLWSRWIGALFLVIYGLKHFGSALFVDTVMTTGSEKSNNTLKSVMICLALTWLNPHVYLDTVMLIGSISIQFESQAQYFALGAMMASWSFFFSLGYGARYLLPWFQKTYTWKILDLIIALIMWSIAMSLVFSNF